MNALSLLGAIILMLFEVIAVLRSKKLMTLLIYSSIAEIGYIILGIGSGTFAGQTGAILHLIYQIIMRGMVFWTAYVMIRRAGSQDTERLKGAGKVSPYIATMFAFGIFSVMGLSPFKGSISKFLIVYSCIENGSYVFAAMAMLGSIIEAWYFIKTLHKICFEEAQGTPQTLKFGGLSARERFDYVGVTVLAVITALTSLYPDTLINFSENTAASLLGAQKLAELPVFDTVWPMVVLVPYIGAFAVYIVGRLVPKLRGVLAVAICAVTFGMVWTSGDIDGLSRLFALVISGITLLTSLYSVGYFKNEKRNDRYFFFLLLTLGSLLGVATSTQLGTFYVFWELMTWASYLLIVHEPTQKALKAGFLYFMMCTSGAYIMQFGILMMQSATGTLDMAEVAEKLPFVAPGMLIAIIVMIIIGTGVKAGLVPMHSWLPEAHPAAPSPFSAILSGVLTKIGIYGMVRILFAVFGIGLLTQLGATGGLSYVGLVISILGIVTLLYGETMALLQKDIKRMLAYSTMAQIGEIVTVLGLGTYLSLVAGFYHVINHAIMKSLLFLGAGILVYTLKTREISAYKGIGKKMPLTAGCLSIGILAIMGLPPFNGFMSKFLMLFSAVDAGYWYFAAFMLLGSIIGAIYYIKLIKTIFFEKYEGPDDVKEAPLSMLIPIIILTGLVVFNGLFPQYSLNIAKTAADYIAAKGQMAVSAIPSIQISWPVIVLIPMLGSLVSYVLGRKSPKAAGWISVTVMAATVAAIIAYYPRLDVYSFWFALLIAFVGLLNMLYSLGYMAHEHAQNRYYMFFLMMIGGLIGVAVSRDFFSFFVFWEIMSSWTLYFCIIHEETKDAIKEGFKYFIFNYIGASIAFLGLLVLTVGAGTFDMGSLSQALGGMDTGTAAWGIGLMLVGFLMKAAVMPFRIDYQMHPATAPTPVSGFISSVLLKSAPFWIIKLLFMLGGVMVFARLGTSGGGSVLLTVMSWIAGLTIVGAGAMALVQRGIKRLLIYSTVSQIGYIILGLSLGTALGLSGALLHFVNHMFFKDLLFLCAGAIMVQAHAHNLDEISGLGRKMPYTLSFFMVGALSLAGVPPFSGFTSKWIIYEAAMQQGQVFLAILSLLGSMLSMAYFIKFMHSAFFGVPSKNSENVKEAPLNMLVPMGALAAISLVFGIMPGLPLKAISKILALAGLNAPSFTLFSVETPIGTGQIGVITMLILLALVVGAVFLLSNSKKIRYTDAYTCGVSDIDTDKINASSQNMFEPAAKLIRKLHKKLIVPVFGDGEEAEK